MEPSRLEELVERSVRLGEENAVELHKIRVQLFWSGVIRVVTWLVVAGVPFFLYLHLVKPSFQNFFAPFLAVFGFGS